MPSYYSPEGPLYKSTIGTEIVEDKQKDDALFRQLEEELERMKWF